MNILSRGKVAQERAGATGIDGDVGPVGEETDFAGVGLGEVEGDVAGDGGDGEKVEFGRGGDREQDGDGVIDTGVAVDDQGFGGGHGWGKVGEIAAVGIESSERNGVGREGAIAGSTG